jgi:hypothetical protein
MRCALIEFNAYHDEVLPTFVWLLNRLGVMPDVYMAARSARRRPFAGSAELRFRRRSVETIGRLLGLEFRLRRYELLIVNSMEPRAVLDRLTTTTTPLLGVVHNTELLVDDPAYQSFFGEGRRAPLVLGRHIADALSHSQVRASWISHVVFGSATGSPDPFHDPTRPTTFVVSGNVEAHRRNYDALLAAAQELDAAGVPFLIRIVGRSSTPDGTALKATIAEHGLSGRFEFTSGVIDHPRFFELVAGSDFSLPLLDTSRAAFRAYLDTKLASSVSFAIGLGVPLVADAAVIDAYGVHGTGPSYEGAGLADAMRRAITSSAAERADWRAALHRKREELLASSLANLRGAIAAVGVTVGS